MHEYSIIQSLVSRVQKEADAVALTEPGASPVVRKLYVRIGDAAGVDRGLLATAFDTFRAGTLCAEASMQITAVAVRWACPGCSVEIPSGEILRCSDCQRPAHLIEGDEIYLDRIEMEVEDV